MADKTWDLVHDRADEDPVKRRVIEGHEALARLSASSAEPETEASVNWADGDGASRGFDLRTGARTLAVSLQAGAALAALTLMLPHGAMVATSWRSGSSCGFAVVVGAAPSWRAPRCREREVQAALVVGGTVIGLANYFVGTPTLYALLYSWVALYAFAFFGRASPRAARATSARRTRRLEP